MSLRDVIAPNVKIDVTLSFPLIHRHGSSGVRTMQCPMLVMGPGYHAIHDSPTYASGRMCPMRVLHETGSRLPMKHTPAANATIVVIPTQTNDKLSIYHNSERNGFKKSRIFECLNFLSFI